MFNSLSIVIPALNEPYLDELKIQIDKVLHHCISIDNWEIIIRDDVGCGNAICKGIQESSHDIVCVLDGDGSHNPKYIPMMFHYINKEKYNLVYGYKAKTLDSFYRQLVTRSFDELSRMFIMNLPDLMSGYFMFYRSGVSYPLECEHPKVLMKIIRMNPEEYLRIKPIPIFFEKRKKGKSKLDKPSVAYSILKDMIW